MAESLAHRWGQIIGDILEKFVFDILNEVAVKNKLFLDYMHPRSARNALKKVSWHDGYGNKHDLDYVLERGGTDDLVGVPVAFIESAWRRYKKHSKNKAQEIEAAVLPVASAFSQHHPFCGAILAGEFTDNAIQQLESKGFVLLIIPYASVLSAFAELKIDASSEDSTNGTSELQFRRKIALWESKKQPQATRKIVEELWKIHAVEIASFTRSLESVISRAISSVNLTLLHGASKTYSDITSAITFLVNGGTFSDWGDDANIAESIEIEIHFNTKAEIKAVFTNRVEAIAFLRNHLTLT